MRLDADFYARPTLDVLRDIIGKRLVHDVGGRRTSGVIVEAEAYIGESDPACHAAAGRTSRNAPLYGPPGFAYVYFNYGVHYLVNAVTEGDGCPAAVLIRALEPAEGVSLMRRRRVAARRRRGLRADPPADVDLCRGPGNLTIALAIGPRQNYADLTSGSLCIEDTGAGARPLIWSPRVGIRVGVSKRWRCHAAGSLSVSGRRG